VNAYGRFIFGFLLCSAAAKKLKRSGSQKKKNAKKFGTFIAALTVCRRQHHPPFLFINQVDIHNLMCKR